ncbi:MAG: glycosyltransferase [Egibacteraceae bacterium]
MRGGIETVVHELLAALAVNTLDRHNRRVAVDCYCYAPQSSDERLSAGVMLRRRRTTAVVASAPMSVALARAYWRERRTAEIIHVHLPNPWAALLVALLHTRASVIVSVHATSTRYGLLQRPHAVLTHRVLRRADRIVVSTLSNARLFGLGPYREKVCIIPYGIDPARLAPPGPVAEAVTDKTSQVLFVGRLVYYKGLDTLLSAAPALHGDVLLLGDGPLYLSLRARVEADGLTGKVMFIRDADDATLARHLRDCAVVVLPSSTISESFGISVLEAMAVGKPVVVSQLGTGLDELVRTARSGRIVPPNDAAALATAINALLDDPAERARLGANGQHAFWEHYTSDQMASRLLQLYETVASSRPH